MPPKETAAEVKKRKAEWNAIRKPEERDDGSGIGYDENGYFFFGHTVGGTTAQLVTRLSDGALGCAEVNCRGLTSGTAGDEPCWFGLSRMHRGRTTADRHVSGIHAKKAESKAPELPSGQMTLFQCKRAVSKNTAMAPMDQAAPARVLDLTDGARDDDGMIVDDVLSVVEHADVLSDTGTRGGGEEEAAPCSTASVEGSARPKL